MKLPLKIYFGLRTSSAGLSREDWDVNAANEKRKRDAERVAKDIQRDLERGDNYDRLYGTNHYQEAA